MVAPPKPEKVSVAEAVDKYLDACAARVKLGRFSPDTLEIYSPPLHFLIEMVGAETLLDDVSGADMDKALLAYATTPDRRRAASRAGVGVGSAVRVRKGSESHKSATSQNMFYATMATFFREAQKRQWVQESPVIYMELSPAKAQNRDPKRESLTLEQAQAVLDYGAGDRSQIVSEAGLFRWLNDNAVLHLLLYTGCRNSELTGANREDFRANSSGGASWTIYGKGGKSRTVPIRPDLWEILCEFWDVVDRSLASGWFVRPDAVDAQAAFMTTRGNRLSRVYMSRLAEKAQRNVAAVPEVASLAHRFVPHALRHTAATQLVAAGADVKQIKEILGHGNLATTSLYLDHIPGELEATVGRSQFVASSSRRE